MLTKINHSYDASATCLQKNGSKWKDSIGADKSDGGGDGIKKGGTGVIPGRVEGGEGGRLVLAALIFSIPLADTITHLKQ